MTVNRPDPLRMDNNDFAYRTMSERVPGIIREVQAANADFSPGILRALDHLHDMLIQDQPIPSLDRRPVAPPDVADWDAALRAQQARITPLTWLHSEWFFAETFLYRHLIQAVRWHETDRDPFAYKKRTEFERAHFWKLLDTALSVEGTLAERLDALFTVVLWGNRVDLSHPAGLLASETASDDELLVDDRDRVLGDLLGDGGAGRGGTVHIIADNAGTELTIDLALADVLLSAEGMTVVLHVKAHPTFVSDATISDVWTTVRALADHGGEPARLAARLRHAWADERLRLSAPLFWNSGHFLWDMPPDLRRAFEGARLVVIKGDLNYRRAIGDAIWPDGVTFSEAMRYFPAPVVALRSLKSDTLVGVPASITGPLDAAGEEWRPTGRYGVIQYAGAAQTP
jgi:uncharacterized protein with ATP-grasp and redox domains